MGGFRFVYVPWLIIVVAVAPIFCPCHRTVITAIAFPADHGTRCTMATGICAARCAVLSENCLAHRPSSNCFCCVYRLFSGVVSGSRVSFHSTHGARLNRPVTRQATCDKIARRLTRCSHRHLAELKTGKSLLRQHCALRI